MSAPDRSTLIRRTSADEAPLGGERGEALGSDELLQYPLFSKISKTLLDKNPGSVWLRTYQPAETICRQGEYGSTAFCIQSGTVEIYIDTTRPATQPQPRGGGLFARLFGSKPAPHRPISADASLTLDPSTRRATLTAGDFFGEMTCLSFLPRAATVVAKTQVSCLEMLRNILLLIFDNKDQKVWRNEKKKFLRANPGKRFEVRRPADTAVQKIYRERALVNDLRGCELFANLPEDVLRRLVERADFLSMEPGEVIFQAGDPADDLFLVRRGFVKVARHDDGSEIVMNYLSRGQYFGEIALLGAAAGRQTTRTATCSAIDHVDLIAIGREDVEDLLSEFSEFRRSLREMADARQAVRKPPPIRPGFNFKSFLDQELMQGTSLLLFDLDRCTRCDECVRACADSHGGVTRLKRDGLRFDKYLVPTSCRSCRDPVCLSECPVGSIGRSPTGAIIIEDWCIGCRKCEENCPYGNIEMHLFDVDEDTEIFKQQQPVRMARVRFDPPDGLNLSCLPLGLSYDARSGELEYAAVPGAAGAEELNAFFSHPAYRGAIESLMKKIETRIPLPILPADFKPPRDIENVVKLKRASKTEPDNSVIFRGVIDRSNLQLYLSASQDQNYRRAVEQAAGKSRGMRAVLSKAVVCDLCESVQQEPNCVYACPHDAAFRVDADVFFKSSQYPLL